MPRFEVTTALTSYETYEVEAGTPEEARRAVLDNERRAALRSWPDGEGDDLMIVAVRRRPTPTPAAERGDFLAEIRRRL